jgi:hypothetical protein
MWPQKFRALLFKNIGEKEPDNYLHLESREFMAKFCVRGSDQVEGRVFLKPAVMERLLKLRTQLGEISVSIVAGRLNIIVWNLHGLCDVDGRKAIDKRQARKVRNWLYWLIGTIDIMGLEKEKEGGR